MSRKGKKAKRGSKKPLRNQKRSIKPNSIPGASAPTNSHTPGNQYTTNETNTTSTPASSVDSIAGPSKPPVAGDVTGMRYKTGEPTSVCPEISQENIGIEPKAAKRALKKSENDEQPVNTPVPAPAEKKNHQEDKPTLEDSTVLRSPLKRLRKQPQRFEIREPEVKPREKSIFEGISRDSLQRYMAHYDVPRRYDLKSKLVERVQTHFDTIDASKINLEELSDGIWARLRQTKQEETENGRK